MSASDPVAQNSDELVDSLIKIPSREYEIWKYFEDRADGLGERLWSTGIWLMTVIAATLSLPFAAKFIDFPKTGFPVRVSAALPVASISLFGIAFLIYSWLALRDIQQHILENWAHANCARTGLSREAEVPGRRRHAWYVLLMVGGLALAAFVGLLVLAGQPMIGMWVSC